MRSYSFHIVFCSILLQTVSLFAGEKQEKLTLPSSGKFSLLRSNISPTRGMFGIQAGVGRSYTGGDAHLFEGGQDAPHGDFTVIFGFDYWKHQLNSLDYHIGLNSRYAQYHFHFTPEGANELKGYFNLLYFSIPFSLHISIPNYKFLQLIAGFSVASMNFFPTQKGNLANYQYQSFIDLSWYVAPELFIGINFMEEKTDYLLIRGNINYTSFFMRNQSFGINMSNGTNQLSDGRRMNSGKVELQITIYPKWKFKNAPKNDQGVNCPAPF